MREFSNKVNGILANGDVSGAWRVVLGWASLFFSVWLLTKSRNKLIKAVLSCLNLRSVLVELQQNRILSLRRPTLTMLQRFSFPANNDSKFSFFGPVTSAICVRTRSVSEPDLLEAKYASIRAQGLSAIK